MTTTLVARAEAVHLDQQLVERLVLLAGDVVAARGADRVELVDEDDRRRVLARLAEQAPDARRAEAGEHLDERRRRLREEARRRTRGPRPWPAASCRCRAGRAAGSPFGTLAPSALEALRVAQELHDLAQLVLGLLDAGDVVPADGLLRGLGLISCGLVLRHELQRAPQEEDDQRHEEHRAATSGPRPRARRS